MKVRFRADALSRAAFFAFTPAVGVGGGMAIPVLLTLAGALSMRPSLLRQAIEKKPLALGLLLAFVGWAVFSSAWSVYSVHTQALKLAILVPVGLLFVAAAVADPDARRLTRAAGLAAFLVLALSLGVEALTNLALNRIAQPDEPVGELARNVSRGATIAMAMTWGAAAALWRRPSRAGPWWAAGVLVIGAAVSTQFGQDSNLVGFVLGLMAFAAAFWRPEWTLRLVSLGLAGWLLVAPFATPLFLSNQSLVGALPTSWAVRTGIWSYVCAHILEAPLVGHGLDASRAVTDRINVRGMDIRAVPLHPHSGSLQVWYETGAIGALLAAAVLVVGGWSLARALGDNRPAAAAASATLACLGLIANVSFGLWQEWWIATMFLAAALVGALSRRPGVG